MDPEAAFHCVVVGDMGPAAKRLTCERRVVTVTLPDGRVIPTVWWKVGGTPTTPVRTSHYVQNADVVVVMYDVRNQAALATVDKWLETVCMFRTPVLVVGRQPPLGQTNEGTRAVPVQAGYEYAHARGVGYCECRLQTPQGQRQLVREVVRRSVLGTRPRRGNTVGRRRGNAQSWGCGCLCLPRGESPASE